MGTPDDGGTYWETNDKCGVNAALVQYTVKNCREVDHSKSCPAAQPTTTTTSGLCSKHQIGCAISAKTKSCVIDGTYYQCTGILGKPTIAGAKNGYFVGGTNWLQAIKCGAQSGCTTSDETKPCVLTSAGYKLACADTTTTTTTTPTTTPTTTTTTTTPTTTVPGVTKISTGQCINGNANIGTSSPAAKAAGILVGGGGLSTVERCRDDCRKQQEAGIECFGFTFYKIWGGCVLWNQAAISNGCKFRPLTVGGKQKCWMNTPEECETYTVTRVFPMSTTKPGTPKPMKTCYSVGDPHVKTFVGGLFDTHRVGWKPFYAKGSLVIELNQQTQLPNNPGGATINSAIRYSTNGGTTWVMRTEGDLLGPNKDESEMQFSDPNVKLTVSSPDVSTGLPTARRMYNVYVTTN